MSEGASSKRRIAVLGGGVSSLAAAYWLTNGAEARARHEVTVYQMGWRLGGKGASGRNRAAHDRIEEHGFHLLFGFYDNVFALMRAVYAELGRGPGEPLSEFVAPTAQHEEAHPGRYAVRRHDNIVHFEQFGGRSYHFPVQFPRNDALPGDAAGPRDAWGYVAVGLGWLRELGALDDAAGATRSAWYRELWTLAPDAAALAIAGLELFRTARIALGDERAFVERVRSFARGLAVEQRRALRAFVVERLRARLRRLWDELEPTVRTSWESHRRWTAHDWLVTQIIGVLEDDVLERGFDSINRFDYAEWLARHATVDEGTRITLASSWVRGAYDSCFAYVSGPDGSVPSMEAGTMLRGGLRLNLGYKGAVSYMFQAGTGDAIFAPLYEVLRRRGVTFRFFHRVDRLGVTPGAHPTLDRLHLAVQAKTIGGAPYEPLVDVHGLPCWPSEPRWELLERGEELRAKGAHFESPHEPTPPVETLVLERGRDFDEVVCGIPIAALKAIGAEVAAASPRFATMLERVRTTRTVGLQVWTTRTVEELRDEPPGLNANVGQWPYAIWADMSDVIARESWPRATRPAHLAYFCGATDDDPDEPAADAGYPRAQHEAEWQRAQRFFEESAAPFWPNAARGGFDWDALCGTRTGPARLREQFLTVNLEPSARYTLSVPGSTEHRLRAGDSGVGHLVLCGDWVKNGLDSGCMEASVMSGMQASRALSGVPARVPGETDFH